MLFTAAPNNYPLKQKLIVSPIGTPNRTSHDLHLAFELWWFVHAGSGIDGSPHSFAWRERLQLPELIPCYGLDVSLVTQRQTLKQNPAVTNQNVKPYICHEPLCTAVHSQCTPPPQK